MDKESHISKEHRDCYPEHDDACTNNSNSKDGRTTRTCQLEKERDTALQEEKQCRESLNVWMECTSLLSTIAGVSYDNYTQSFMGDSLPHSEKGKESKNERHVATTLLAAQKQLDDLQCQWEFSDTPLLSLQQSIHRLQSNGCNFRVQNEQLSNELQTTRRELLQCRTRNKSLEEAVKKLHTQNVKLRDKLKKQKMKRNNFAKNVGEYMAMVQQRHAERIREKHEECEMTKQLTVHERFLRVSNLKQSTRQASMPLDTTTSVNPFTSNNRQRSISMDGYDIHDSGMCPTNREDDEEEDHTDANSSISSLHSFRSLVTDDTYPTVRFESSPREILPRHGSSDDSFEENTEGRRRTRSDGDVVLSAWSSVSFGKQRDRPPTSLESVEKNEGPGGEKASKILGSMFHLPKILHKENPTIEAHFNSLSEINLQFHCVPLQDDVNFKRKNIISEAMKAMKNQENEKVADEEITFGPDKSELCAFRSASLESNTGHSYDRLFPLHSILNGEEGEYKYEEEHNMNKGRDVEIIHENESKHAFLVCGHTSPAPSVVSTQSPDVGSRLVSINDTSLEAGLWTIARLGEMLKEKEKDGGLILTFRNDTLTEQQQKMLDRAVEVIRDTAVSTINDKMLKTAEGAGKDQDDSRRAENSIVATDHVPRPGASSKHEAKKNDHSAAGFFARVSFVDTPTCNANTHSVSIASKKKNEGRSIDRTKNIPKQRNKSSATSSLTPSFFERMRIKNDIKEETKPPKKRIVTLF